MKYDNLVKHLGPGLLLASTAIGASHLVLSTRAGAHHGLIFFGIVIFVMVIKYPFYSYAPKYTALTGKSLITAYAEQGQWALLLFFLIIGLQMFFMVSALGAVCMGLLMVILKLPFQPSIVLISFMSITALILILGKYRFLKKTILFISILLLLTIVLILFFVLLEGPVHRIDTVAIDSFTKGSGLILLISLLGWMPSGMEATAMHSIWIQKNEEEQSNTIERKEKYHLYVFDFKLGYVLTGILALVFVLIGTYTLFGSGKTIDGNTVAFTEKLVLVFTQYLGEWSFAFIGFIALGAMYGTLVSLWDALARCFLECIVVYKEQNKMLVDRNAFLNNWYRILIPILGLGGGFIFILFKDSVIKILEFITITSFVLSPILGFLNWRAMQSKSIPETFRTSKRENIFAFTALLCLLAIGIFYLVTII